MQQAFSDKDQLLGLIAKIVDPSKGRQAKELYNSISQFVESKSIDSSAGFYGYTDAAAPDSDWRKVFQEVPKLQDDRLAWSKIT